MTIKNIIREQLEDKICSLIKKTLDKYYTYKVIEKRYVEFNKVKTDEHGSYSLPYPVRNKYEYWDLYYDMEYLIEEMFGMEGEEIMWCIEEYIDNITDGYLDFSDSDEEYLEEAEEESSGGDSGGGSESKGGGTSSSGKEWESGVTRGPANPITYDSQWTGQRGWEGIKSYAKQRGKANPLE